MRIVELNNVETLRLGCPEIMPQPLVEDFRLLLHTPILKGEFNAFPKFLRHSQKYLLQS